MVRPNESNLKTNLNRPTFLQWFFSRFQPKYNNNIISILLHIHVKTKELRSSDCINCLYNKDVAYEMNRSRFSKNLENFRKFFLTEKFDREFV